MKPARPLSEGNRLQRAYHRWAAPHYARMAPDLRVQAELLDRFLYSRQGLVFWAGLLAAAVGSAHALQRAGLKLPLAVVASVLLWGVLPLMLLAAWLQPALFSLSGLRRKLPVAVGMALVGGVVGYLVGHLAFLTSGRSRKLKLGSQTIELQHAPPWQLLFPGQAAGEVIRSLAWVGPSGSEAALGKLMRKLPASDLQAVAGARARLPTWLASQVSALVPRA